MDIVVIGPTIRFAKTLLHDGYIFCAFRLRLEFRGHSSATFSLGRVGDINQVDLNNLKMAIFPKIIDLNKINLYFKVQYTYLVHNLYYNSP